MENFRQEITRSAKHFFSAKTSTELIDRIINAFVRDLVKKSVILATPKKKALSSKEAQTITCLLLGESLRKHAILEGEKACAMPKKQIRAKLLFPLPKVKKTILHYTGNATVELSFVIFASAVLEYITAEIMDLAHETEGDLLTHDGIVSVIKNDVQLCDLIQNQLGISL